MATTPDNPATALRAVLRTVLTQESSVAAAWQALLGAPVGSVDFTQRHSEVVGLFRQVYELLLGLPEGDEREQYLSYMPHCYQVIVYPGPWDDPANASGAVNVVDHLTGIASTFRLHALTTQVSDDAVSRLRAAISDWYPLLDEADFDEKLANEIRSQVRHLEWLLDNANLLGMQPVVRAVKELAGTGISAMTVPAYQRWWGKIGRVTGVCLVFLAVAKGGVQDVNAILDAVRQIPQHILDIGDAFTFDEPGALTSGDGAAAATDSETPDTIDGEVVSVEDDERPASK